MTKHLCSYEDAKEGSKLIRGAEVNRTGFKRGVANRDGEKGANGGANEATGTTLTEWEQGG